MAPPDGTLRNDLFLRACFRRPVERTPVWIMRQAGRYLPEYRALREKADFLTACRTPELACEITLQPIRRLGADAAILFSDILIPLPGMGVGVEFNPGPVIENPARTRAAVEALRVPDAREATPFVLDAVRLIRRELAGAVPLIGFAGAPFTVATYIVEGGGSKSFGAIKRLLYGDPDTAHLLLAKCADTLASYLSEQVRAGAQAAMLFDTWAGILSPEDYRTFAAPYARRVFEAVGQAACGMAAAPGGSPPVHDLGIPRIYYAGEAAGYLEAVAGLGAEVIGLDWRMGLDTARCRLGDGLALQGNLDPCVLFGPPGFIEARAREVLVQARAGAVDVARCGQPQAPDEGAWSASGAGGPGIRRRDSAEFHARAFAGSAGTVGAGVPNGTADPLGPVGPAVGHIFNLGHGILPETPPEHAVHLVETVRRLSSAA